MIVKVLNRLLITFIFLVGLAASAHAQSDSPALPEGGGKCEGEFLNPISDVCWECLAPITIGKIEVAPSSKFDYGNPGNPFCFCPPIPGIAIGYWEPRRLIDMTKKPWCFPNLGGLKLDPGIGFETGSVANDSVSSHLDDWHAHYYVYPVLSLLQLLTDVLCSEAPAFDIGYVTELDPVWKSDVLATIINPESVVFANPVATLACTADCAQTTADKPNKDLFWCMGCHNSVYPLTGNIADEDILANGALSVAQRLSFKLHRQAIMWTTAGDKNLCEKSPQILMDKRQYRYQLTQPKAITSGPFTCPPLGFPTQTYDTGVTVPIKGEDFGVLLWGKRNCCAL